MIEDMFNVVPILIFGVIFFVVGLRAFRQKRLIENIPTSKIRSLAMGLVEIYGKVMEFKKPLFTSPMTNKDCVYYKYEIEEYSSGRDGKSGRWKTIHLEEKRQPFFVKDETGQVLVDSEGATIWLGGDNFKSRGGLMPSNMSKKYSEFIIRPNDNLYVLGTAGKNPHLKGTAKLNQDGIMIQQEKGNKYYISDGHESEITKGFKLISWSGLIIGGLMIVGSVSMILLSF
ncbi:MAG: GIDE domain-containing protein [Candidatus Aenigmatarchaeota archaeon]